MRRQAFVMTPAEACASIGGWMLIVSLLIYPLFKDMADSAFASLAETPYLIALGLLKGFGFWGMNFAGQTVRKTSNSSAGFYSFICIGLIAIGNSIFGEELSVFQWGSVVVLTLTGLYFTFRGHLNTQPFFIQLMFMAMVSIGCMFGMIDHYFLTHANWYGLLLLTGVGMTFSSCVLGRMPLRGVARCVLGRQTMCIGILLAFSEVMILSILVTHLPVTLAWVAMALVGPVVMVISSLLWGEGRWQEQLLVGGISYAAAIPIAIGM